MTAPTHRCLRGRHCTHHTAGRDIGGATGPDAAIGAHTAAPHTLCTGCEKQVAPTIAALPRLYTELETVIAHRSSASEHVSGTREPPTPLRLDVLALQTELDAVLSAWAAPVADRRRIRWDVASVRRLRSGPRVHRAAHLLAASVDALLRLPAVPLDVWTSHGVITVKASGLDGALRLLRLHHRGRLLVTGGNGDSRLPVPCPQCEAPALVRANGGDQVTCRGCGSSWPESDYRRLCLILADDYRPARPARSTARRSA